MNDRLKTLTVKEWNSVLRELRDLNRIIQSFIQLTDRGDPQVALVDPDDESDPEDYTQYTDHEAQE